MDMFYENLSKIKERPNIYLGKPSLERLRAFTDGYLLCLRQMDNNRKYDFYPGFDEFMQKKYNIKTTKGWVNIIQSYSSGEDEAFDTFFELLEEFRSNV